MKPSNRYRVKAAKIRSLKDLELERQRLKLEILKTEEHIHQDYRRLLDAFTLRNITASVVGDVAHSASILGKAFAFGKAIMARRKKKKHADS